MNIPSNSDHLIYDLHIGESPIVISMPHSGLDLPQSLSERFTEHGLALIDTDWHIPKLYNFAKQLDITVIKANYSRYVVDLNRPPGGESLYPGKETTGTCPTITFSNLPLYKNITPLSKEEIDFRIGNFWNPYHIALSSLIKKIRDTHGYCILYDAHSIRSHVPRLFNGTLPTLNLGTAKGTSCNQDIQKKIEKILSTQNKFSWVENGRFIGGYITRHYGNPKENIHAIQMELAQNSYMNEDSNNHFCHEKAVHLQALLHQIFESLLTWNPRKLS